MIDKTIQVRKISQKFIHPKYDPKHFYDNDIGIVKVDKAFEFNHLVGKIDLPMQDYEPKGKLNSKIEKLDKFNQIDKLDKWEKKDN